MWTIKSNSFGTFHCVNGNNSTSSQWNLFEHTPVEDMDDFQKLQKQKYDYLKSQNKMIKMERRATWFLVLNRELNQFKKVMTSESIIEVSEK